MYDLARKQGSLHKALVIAFMSDKDSFMRIQRKWSPKWMKKIPPWGFTINGYLNGR